MRRSPTIVALAFCAASCGTGDHPIVPDDAGVTATTSTSSGGAGGSSSSGGAGGTASTSPGLGYENGSRLRAVVYHGADGSRQFKTWYDTSRDEECSFGVAADGLVRCLPSGAVAGTYYSDPACSQPLAAVQVGTCPATPQYAVFYREGTCPMERAIHQLGEAFSGASIYHGDPCTGTTALAGFVYYVVGLEVSAAAFVRAVESAP